MMKYKIKPGDLCTSWSSYVHVQPDADIQTARRFNKAKLLTVIATFHNKLDDERMWCYIIAHNLTLGWIQMRCLKYVGEL